MLFNTNFDVLHIDGKKNVEADALSRLVPFPTKQDQPMKLNNLEQTNIIKRHEYLSKTIFKKIQQAHNGIVGHSGVQKTIERLQRINQSRSNIKKNFLNYLTFIQQIMNTQVNLRTRISPTQLIFGNTVNHDSHFLSEPIDNNLDDSATQYMSNLLTIQQKIIKIALDNQEENDTHQISVRQNQGNYKQTYFPIDSYVLAQYETYKDSKLHTKKHGPYRVVNRIGTVYTLENLVTNKLVDFHVKLLSAYNHDENNSDIIKVAKIDEELSDIVKILNHRFRGHKKTLSNLELQLVWEDDPNPNWFPWNSTFRSNELIHKYFNENQMRKFIPPEFTWGKDHPDYEPPTKRSRK